MKSDHATFTVSLASAGNPDHRQFFDGGIFAPSVQKRCASVAECQQAVRDYLVKVQRTDLLPKPMILHRVLPQQDPQS